MDPVSHAVIGMAVSTAGQDVFSIMSPITMATVAGSLIPDGDIVLRAWGGSSYLKHHRGISHSLVGIGIEAVFVGLALKMFYPSAALRSLIFWSFIGALTHILSDILNSYGAKIFWPFSKRKKSLSLLTLTDPVVFILSVLSIFSSGYGWGYNDYIIFAFLLYLASKVIMRIWALGLLKKEYNDKYNIEKIHLLPSMIAGHKFHYIVEDSLHRIVGEIDFFLNKIKIIDTFRKIDHITKEHILESKTAKYFRDFTPIFHINIEKINNGHKALLTDLRYILRGKFLHHATIIYDKDMRIIEEKFNPYSINKKLDV